MALLSQVMRTAAFTGSTDSVFTSIVGRQGRQWTERTVGAAFPPDRPQQPFAQRVVPQRPSADRATALREITSLRESGVLTDAEFERLRTRLEV